MLLHTIGSKFQGGVPPLLINIYFQKAKFTFIRYKYGRYTRKMAFRRFSKFFGISYSKTLRKWYNNIKDWDDLDNYDIRFRRMWEFYLLSCSALFSIKNLYLFQLVYTKDKNKSFDCYYIRN